MEKKMVLLPQVAVAGLDQGVERGHLDSVGLIVAGEKLTMKMMATMKMKTGDQGEVSAVLLPEDMQGAAHTAVEVAVESITAEGVRDTPTTSHTDMPHAGGTEGHVMGVETEPIEVAPTASREAEWIPMPDLSIVVHALIEASEVMHRVVEREMYGFHLAVAAEIAPFANVEWVGDR